MTSAVLVAPGMTSKLWTAEGSAAKPSSRAAADTARKLHVAPAHPEVAVGHRDQAHRHAVGPHVDADPVVVDPGQLADGTYQLRPGGERPGGKYVHAPSLPTRRQSSMPSAS